MTALPVEWVLAIFYGRSAHRATYGRLAGTYYTKDYIQLYRSEEFLGDLKKVFPDLDGPSGSVSLEYVWHNGSTSGELVRQSADRPHLKWETSSGAPLAWRMVDVPTEQTAETIPGNPNLTTTEQAEEEFNAIASRGAGQPYLFCVKLQGEPNRLHLRTYLDGADSAFAWAGLERFPPQVRDLARTTSQSSTLAWKSFNSTGIFAGHGTLALLGALEEGSDPQPLLSTITGEQLEALGLFAKNPGKGIFFDPTLKVDAWSEQAAIGASTKASLDHLVTSLQSKLSISIDGDAMAEYLDHSLEQVQAFESQIEANNYSVEDAHGNVKVRGSAQRAFAAAVKRNYGSRCAITGISTPDFLVAAHIVPWSCDHTIRLDPANGICLSLLVDRAFENGYLLIGDDLRVAVNWKKVDGDSALKALLNPYDGVHLESPGKCAPKVEYLQRRRALLEKEEPSPTE
jgi:hypothetical protein